MASLAGSQLLDLVLWLGLDHAQGQDQQQALQPELASALFESIPEDSAAPEYFTEGSSEARLAEAELADLTVGWPEFSEMVYIRWSAVEVFVAGPKSRQPRVSG